MAFVAMAVSGVTTASAETVATAVGTTMADAAGEMAAITEEAGAATAVAGTGNTHYRADAPRRHAFLEALRPILNAHSATGIDFAARLS